MSERKSVKISDNSQGRATLDSGNKLGRDVVYVDTDDDITSIISKVKDAKNSVVAIVPPARIGALQSVVNLKLLQRAAKTSRKKISLVTTDKALNSLAAGLEIPVAKNLSTDAKVPSSEDSSNLDNSAEDEISAKDMTIGELAALGDDADSKDDSSEVAAVDAIENDDKISGADTDPYIAAAKPKTSGAKAKPSGRGKIPDFASFRKKLLIIGGGVLVLVAFFVWAIFFAAHGTITVIAKTSSQDIAANLALQPSGSTDVANSVVAPTTKTVKKTETVQFSATGTQMVGGAKATGSVIITNASSSSEIDLPSGTTLTDNSGNQYVLDKATTVPGVTVSGGSINPSTVKASITAYGYGVKYNSDSSSVHLSIAGYNSKVSADSNGAISGGQDQTSQQVVQQSDLDAAVGQIQSQDDQSTIKGQLEKEFGDSVVPIDASFGVSYGKASSTPAVGAAVGTNSKPTASLVVTYTMLGIAKSDLGNFVDKQALASVQNSDGQKVYDNGLAKVKFANFSPTGQGNYSVTVQTTAQVGPAIDANEIKKNSLGKKSGEIQSSLSSIAGVDSVKVDFSPFWVSTIDDASKLDVKFTVNK